jgi:exopolyphosphatase / guanosine-5'-triphosphate,3'-diphosphate pyrophosphatase
MAKQKMARERGDRMVAVIDIGTTFIRMMIAEQQGARNLCILERAVQSVALGQEIVTDKRISNAASAQCVRILRSFRRLLDEYRIPPESVTAVATFTLGLADNCDVFLDRLATTTRLPFRLLDPGQIGYYYHLAVRSLRDKTRDWEKGEAVVLDIGGLSCGMLCRKNGEVRYMQTFSVGALFLRRQMEAAALKPQQYTELADGRTHEMAQRIRKHVDRPRTVTLLLMGRAMRFAATRLHAGRNGEELPDTAVTTLAIRALEKLLRQVVAMTPEEIVRQWRLAFPDAEILAPALSIAVSVAHAVGLERVHVSSLSFSHGLIEEAASSATWTATMRKHVLRVARETGEKYQYDARHAEQVAAIALDLFDLLREEHGCDPRQRLLLEVAALVHDIGVFVSAHAHNKHSLYLIRNTEFAGLTREETELIAVVCRYHRKSIPRATHVEYRALDKNDRLVVSKLAALLRVADALDRVHDQSLGRIRFDLTADALVCIPDRPVMTSAEQVALAEKGNLFELMFGRKCYLYRPT